MNLKDKLTILLYQKSFDGDSYHTYIKFENMDVILEEQTKIAKEYAKMKCQELLSLVVEKAGVKTVTIPNGLNIKTCVVDEDTILNVVDLDTFCS